MTKEGYNKRQWVMKYSVTVTHCVWSRNLKNQEAMADVRPQRQRGKGIANIVWDLIEMSDFLWRNFRVLWKCLTL